MNRWFRQLFAALLKNLHIKARTVRGTLFEILMPSIFMLLLSIGYWLGDNDPTPAQDYMDFMTNTSKLALGSLDNLSAFCVFDNFPGNPLPPDCGEWDIWNGSLNVGNNDSNSLYVGANMALADGLIALLCNLEQDFTIPSLDAYLLAQYWVTDTHGGDNPMQRTAKISFNHAGTIAICGPPHVAAAFKRFLSEESAFFPFIQTDPDHFDTFQEARDYAHVNGNAVWAIIDLTQLEQTSRVGQPMYQISMNYSATPWTFRSVEPVAWQQGLGRRHYLLYLTSGFLTLQTLVNRFVFLEYFGIRLNETAAFADTLGKGGSGGPGLSIAPMPTKGYFTSQFIVQSGHFIPLVMVFSMLYSLSRLVAMVVEEKESRVREAMLIMGLPLSAFYVSWLLTSITMNFIASVGASIVLRLTLFQNVDVAVLIISIFCFSLTVMGLGFLLSVFFSKPRIAAIIGPLIMFIGTVPYYAIPIGTPDKYMYMASILPCTAFAEAVNTIVAYSQNGTPVDLGTMWDGQYPMVLSVLFMLFDTVLYLLIAVYLDHVLPSEFGVRSHPLFFLPNCIFSQRARAAACSKTANLDDIEPNTATDESLLEPFAPATGSADSPPANEVVVLRNIHKIYSTEGGADIHAVKGLSVSFYQGYLQVLLGHNGAGKSTTINMLVGLIPPTSGFMQVCGFDASYQLQQIRQNIGYCPQHNIIWPRLSVGDHLAFFARLKAATWDVEDLVQNTLELVQLQDKRHAPASSLSGGQKRKLCVGIALIGGSPFLLLDEPTAGMDLEARRAMWDLLLKVRRSRCILLSTHFMDEADLLGDRIMILNRGVVHSCGSSLFLKSKLGVGYTVTCVVNTDRTVGALEEAVMAELRKSNASQQQLAIQERGREITFRFPMSLSEHAGGLFRMLERQAAELGVRSFGLSLTTLEDVFLKIAAGAALENAEDCPSRLDATPPVGTGLKAAKQTNNASVFRDEEEPLLHGSATYGGNIQQCPQPPSSSSSSKNPNLHSGSTRSSTSLVDVDDDKNSASNDDDDDSDEANARRQTFWRHFTALLAKRANCAKRDRRMLCFQIVMPIVFMCIALLIMLLHPPDQPPMALDGSQYPHLPNQVLFTASDVFNTTDMLDRLIPNGGYYVGELVPCADPASNASRCLSQALLHGYNDHSELHRYVAVAPFSNNTALEPFGSADPTFTALFNATGVHSSAEAVNLAYTLALRQLTGNPSAGFHAFNSPMPLGEVEGNLISYIQQIVAAIFVLIPFTFIPANFVCFIVKEREFKAKHLQLVAGVNIAAFWASNFVWDLFTYLITEGMCIVVFFAFKRKEYIGDAQTFAATFCLFLFYGLASIPCAYVVSHAFESYTTAQNVTMMVSFFTGFLLVMAAQILSALPSTKETNDKLTKFYRVIPSYALGEGIITLTSRKLSMYLLDSEPGAFSFLDYNQMYGGFVGGVGDSLVYLGAACPVFFAILFAIEGFRQFTIKFSLQSVRPALTAEERNEYGREDADVAAERARVEGIACLEAGGQVEPNRRDDTEQKNASTTLAAVTHGLVVRNMRKVYGSNVAVKAISFAVPPGETFALLGTNGAGKTTTISMVTGEHAPTCGAAFVAGKSVITELGQARRCVGYCPQFDALHEHMSVREHLVLYCRLRGLSAGATHREIERLLSALSLHKFEHTMSRALSGGNKRKLSLAIALIGGTKVILLDEPTAGMDPVARHDLWRSLKVASTQNSIVLTTHHLEEVEALADRVGIMVGGKLQCLGTLQELKAKFAGGAFQLQVSFSVLQSAASAVGLQPRRGPAAVAAGSGGRPPEGSLFLPGLAKHTSVDAANAQEMLAYLTARLPPGCVVELVELNGNKASLAIANCLLSDLFDAVEARKRELQKEADGGSTARTISEYSLSQCTLEQVFLRIGVIARDEAKDPFSDASE
jgi:ATP-binding cassette subfamily A (ABC1) protein 3